jgi:hypothetical protein
LNLSERDKNRAAFFPEIPGSSKQSPCFLLELLVVIFGKVGMTKFRIDPLRNPSQQCKISRSLGQLANSIAKTNRQKNASRKRLLMALQKLEKLAKKPTPKI